MSHDKNHPADDIQQTTIEVAALATFLREVAARAEHDPSFASGVLAIARASGLFPTVQSQPEKPTASQPASPPTRASRRKGRHAANAPVDTTPPDPFKVMRAQGEAGLRAALEPLDLASLRTIVRAHRLDPARLSARWTNLERLIALIVEQTRARLNHGRAFERI
ncbi:MAG TPA: hypothetical protein VKQ36_14990 [Ktedonobacterales bacterium]|nr:hypothetical protein [Ktedonobacterales bacterium]